jgi:(1->4)-alpha-D-glucan 1-alpha-D-glucosylmutase
VLFRDGGYLPLAVEGPAAEHALAYARIHDGVAVLVVAARLTCTLCRGEDSRWAPALWQGTQVALAAESANVRRFRRWRNWLTGAECTLGSDEVLDLDTAFGGGGGLPFAVLLAQAEAA